MRLQGVVRGQNVKRQTMNAMKQMQLLVRVQTQIQSRRIQMLENQAMQRQSCKNDKEAESTLSKCTLNQVVKVIYMDRVFIFPFFRWQLIMNCLHCFFKLVNYKFHNISMCSFMLQSILMLYLMICFKRTYYKAKL